MTAVYYHIDAAGGLLYVGCSVNPFARFGNHACVSPWGRKVARIEIKWCDSQEEALALELAEIKRLNPRHNAQYTTHRRPRPGNEGYKFVAAWESRFGVSGVLLGLAAGCSRDLSSRLAAEVTYPNYRFSRKISIASGGYIPAKAFISGSKFERLLSDDEARFEFEDHLKYAGADEEKAIAFAKSHTNPPNAKVTQ